MYWYLPSNTAKAILRPSGDQLGLLSIPPHEVNCMGFDPSLLHTQTSLAPDRSDKNAIFLPSGEYTGYSSCRVEEIRFTGAPAFKPGLLKSILQMLESYFFTAYARRFPCRDTAG